MKNKYMTYTPRHNLPSACLIPLLVVSHARHSCHNDPYGVNIASNLHILISEKQLASDQYCNLIMSIRV